MLRVGLITGDYILSSSEAIPPRHSKVSLLEGDSIFLWKSRVFRAGFTTKACYLIFMGATFELRT